MQCSSIEPHRLHPHLENSWDILHPGPSPIIPEIWHTCHFELPSCPAREIHVDRFRLNSCSSPPPFHRSAKCSARRERDALPSLLDQEICLDSKNGKDRRTVPGSVYCEKPSCALAVCKQAQNFN